MTPARSRFSHLLAQEVTDLKLAAALLDDAVDGEMGVDGTHLVLEALKTENVIAMLL